jgi:hypothetical protein
VGAAATNWEKGTGSARVGKGGSHPSDRDQRPEHALPSELPTPDLEPVKNFYSRRECKLVNQSRFVNLV